MTNTKCLITEKLYKILLEKGKSRENKPEHGGIFIGLIRGPHLEIDDLTFPSSDDNSKMFSFVRQERYHQKKALDAWKKSNFTKTYIGEWHTHPHGEAIPSTIDKNTWKKIVVRSKRSMVFAISTPLELKFFLGVLSIDNNQSFHLNPIDVDVVK